MYLVVVDCEFEDNDDSCDERSSRNRPFACLIDRDLFIADEELSGFRLLRADIASKYGLIGSC